MERIGYKGFIERNGKLYCRNMEYKVGEIAEVPGEPKICEHGIHFCWGLNDVDKYYGLCSCVICEVKPIGDIVAAPDGKKCCTNKLKVIRMLTKEEVLKISNSGSNNLGYANTGDRNTGDWNTGDRNTGNRNTGNRNTGNRNTGNCNTGNRNTGDWNTGDWNTGDRNTGDCNTGNWNTGNCNTGNRNTGNCNTGDCNTGDCNTGNWNTGFFNTQEHECYIFDQPSGMTPSEFRSSVYFCALNSAPFVLTEWISYTDEERAADKAKELIGGYLKQYSYKEACANWWSALSDEAKATIQQIPNFDAAKFEKITGIKV